MNEVSKENEGHAFNLPFSTGAFGRFFPRDPNFKHYTFLNWIIPYKYINLHNILQYKKFFQQNLA